LIDCGICFGSFGCAFGFTENITFQKMIEEKSLNFSYKLTMPQTVARSISATYQKIILSRPAQQDQCGVASIHPAICNLQA
jgi:hypothetical protein